MTLADIKYKFENHSDVCKVVLKGEDVEYGIRYYFIDYSRMGIKDIDGNTVVGHISRYNGGHSTNEKYYSDMDKFDNAIKRVLKKC